MVFQPEVAPQFTRKGEQIGAVSLFDNTIVERNIVFLPTTPLKSIRTGKYGAKGTILKSDLATEVGKVAKIWFEEGVALPDEEFVIRNDSGVARFYFKQQ